MIRHRPANHAPAEPIQHNGQINERLAHSYISDVGPPELIDRHRHQMPRQVGPDMPVMPRIGRWRTERLLRHAKQIVVTTDPRNPLMVHRPANALKLDRDRPVAVPVAIFTLHQRQELNRIAQRRLFLARSRCAPVTVKFRAAHTGQRAHPFDPQLIALPLRLRADHREDVLAPATSYFGRGALTCRKACPCEGGGPCEKNPVPVAAGRSSAPAPRSADARQPDRPGQRPAGGGPSVSPPPLADDPYRATPRHRPPPDFAAI